MTVETAEVPKLKQPDRRKTKIGPAKGSKIASSRKVENDNRPPATWRKTLRKRQGKFDEQAKQIYLDNLSKTNLKTASAELAEVTMPTIRSHIEKDPDFAQRVKAAEELYRDDFIGHHHNLARHGIRRKKYDRAGNIVEEYIEYPLRLIELELKKIDVGYRDSQSIDLTQTSVGALLAPATMTPEDWMEAQKAKNESKEAPQATKKDGAGDSQEEPKLVIKAA